jgi:hypothetical protein
MRRLLPLALPSWSLPFLVIALIVPSVAAFALLGPQFGLAVGALTVAGLLAVAARARYDEEIEVAASDDDRYRLLLLAAVPVEDPKQVERVEGILAEGARLPGAGGEPQVLVLAPARQSRLARWASDVGEAREQASRVVAISLGSLAAAGIDAVGRVGDDDPVQAVQDQLRGYPANEIAIQESPELNGGAVEEIRRRLDRPVRSLPA